MTTHPPRFKVITLTPGQPRWCNECMSRSRIPVYGHSNDPTQAAPIAEICPNCTPRTEAR